MDQLEISWIQYSPIWEAPSENLDVLESVLTRSLSERTDIVFLPEMFDTGFSMNPDSLAKTMSGITLSWMKLMAHRYAIVVAGSLMIQENDRYHNRFVFVFPSGDMEHYDKRHLFTYGKEDHSYSAGTQRVIIEVKGWKILPLICYDLRFPVWSRNVDGYDLLVYVANWPTARRLHWNRLLQARAIENQVYTLGVNRVGVDGNALSYEGESKLFDYSGELVLDAGKMEGFFRANISRKEQNEYRKKYPFLKDGDQFVI